MIFHSWRCAGIQLASARARLLSRLSKRAFALSLLFRQSLLTFFIHFFFLFFFQSHHPRLAPGTVNNEKRGCSTIPTIPKRIKSLFLVAFSLSLSFVLFERAKRKNKRRCGIISIILHSSSLFLLLFFYYLLSSRRDTSLSAPFFSFNGLFSNVPLESLYKSILIILYMTHLYFPFFRAFRENSTNYMYTC